jgi:hypothetical protein
MADKKVSRRLLTEKSRAGDLLQHRPLAQALADAIGDTPKDESLGIARRPAASGGATTQPHPAADSWRTTAKRPAQKQTELSLDHQRADALLQLPG